MCVEDSEEIPTVVLRVRSTTDHKVMNQAKYEEKRVIWNEVLDISSSLQKISGIPVFQDAALGNK